MEENHTLFHANHNTEDEYKNSHVEHNPTEDDEGNTNDIKNLRPIQQGNGSSKTSFEMEIVIEEIVIQLSKVKRKYLPRFDTKKENYDDRFYQSQAREILFRAPLYQPTPIFNIYLQDLDDELIEKLSQYDVENRYYILREAVCRIFENLGEYQLGYFFARGKRYLEVNVVE